MARWKSLYRQSISETGYLRGVLLNFGSAWAFYLATVFVHQGTSLKWTQPEVYAVLRYFLGFLIFGGLFMARRLRAGPAAGSPPPMKFLIMRGVFNVTAVLCFYRAVALGAAGKANVLNMTYPAFVALFAGPLLREFPRPRTLLLLLISLVGIALNFHEPLTGSRGLDVADLWGIASGISAGLAIVSLRGAAREADPVLILTWMFGMGLIVLLPLSWTGLTAIFGPLAMYIVPSALMGVLGQWLLTASYGRLPATTGSMISSSRIPIALVFGFLVLNESHSLFSWLGAGLIFVCNLLLAFQNSREKDVA